MQDGSASPKAVETDLALADMPMAINMGIEITETVIQVHSL